MITGGTGSFGNAVLNRFLDTDLILTLSTPTIPPQLIDIQYDTAA